MPVTNTFCLPIQNFKTHLREILTSTEIEKPPKNFPNTLYYLKVLYMYLERWVDVLLS